MMCIFYLKDVYFLFKKWVNAWINKVEPISKIKYGQLIIEKEKITTEKFIVQGAYNLLTNKTVSVFPYNPNAGKQSAKIEAQQVIENYYSMGERLQKTSDENARLKKELLDANEKINELSKK